MTSIPPIPQRPSPALPAARDFPFRRPQSPIVDGGFPSSLKASVRSLPHH